MLEPLGNINIGERHTKFKQKRNHHTNNDNGSDCRKKHHLGISCSCIVSKNKDQKWWFTHIGLLKYILFGLTLHKPKAKTTTTTQHGYIMHSCWNANNHKKQIQKYWYIFFCCTKETIWHWDILWIWQFSLLVDSVFKDCWFNYVADSVIEWHTFYWAFTEMEGHTFVAFAYICGISNIRYDCRLICRLIYLGGNV